MPLIILGLLVVIPILLLLWLKTNAAVVFLALCAGSLLPVYVGPDAALLVNSIFPSANNVSPQIVNIVLLLLPAFLTALFMRKSLSGGKGLLNILPVMATGFLVPLLVVPQLSLQVQASIVNTQFWQYLDQFRNLVVAGGILFSLLVIWANQKKNHHGKKH